MNRFFFTILFFLGIHFSGISQVFHQASSSEIKHKLHKLNVLANVLYVAAHPDDENTRLIAYLENELLANTGYLSMTRGDGGQNLIGPEIREQLGVIRTQELLAARSVDGGQQFFTRANDFGYSKTPEETQEIWNRDDVLSDVVRVYRNFRPDVIITRFPTDGRGGHGHHTTSAILAEEAFDISGNPSFYSDQLKSSQVWSPVRLYNNTGRWWLSDIDENTPGVLTVNVGSYNALLGTSYTEMAAKSRTMHKSQGFGSTGSRGEEIEFLEFLKGKKAENNLFDNIDITWGRVQGGEKIQKLIDKIIKKYNQENPSSILPQLVQIRQAISALDDVFWRELKLKEIDEIIKDCLGLYLEANTSDYSGVGGDEIKLEIEITKRSNVDLKLEQFIINPGNIISHENISLSNNIKFNKSISFSIPTDAPISQPYWLIKEGTLGMYRVDDERNLGRPENIPPISVEISVNLEGEIIAFNTPLIYKWNDPVDGEQYRLFSLTPPVFSTLQSGVFVFEKNKPQVVSVVVKSGKNDVQSKTFLQLPKGWKSEPQYHEVYSDKKGDEHIVEFKIFPPEIESDGEIRVVSEVDGNNYSNSFKEIKYSHIPIQFLMSDSKSKIVSVDLKKGKKNIGYIQGAGDLVPNSLRTIGYEVTELNDSEINFDHIKNFDAIVLGVRALNTRDRLPFFMEDLLEYVKNGGTLVVQYNTSRGVLTDNFAPYSINLSRDRVTKEEAPVTVLAKDHPVMNYPNKIQESDFSGWVQERGLYFPDTWSDEYEAILSCKDPNEEPKNGGLLVAKYGKGYYVYTGYSWFRQLPAGVPGAIKLFVNILSLGQYENREE